jgi:hypothetical protein
MEATSGASRAARGDTETLSAHGAGEERQGMRKHPGRRRSGYHIIGGGQPAQYVVRVSDMYG